MGKTVFLIEDEPDMVKIATDLLESDGYLVSSATHPEDGLKAIRAKQPSLILLDIRLPDMDGFQVLKELKADPKTKRIPVILVSVKTDETDVVVGLELGAEDYIAKPYRKKELLARIKTILRRNHTDPDDPVVEVGNLKVDYGNYSTWMDGKEVMLTPKEFELLAFFVRRKGRVLTRATISENVWQMSYTGSTRTIDVHVDQLRKKLGPLSSWIKGLKGIGYRFEPEED